MRASRPNSAPHDGLFGVRQSPIYGRQILYFLDPVFSRRSKMPAPERSDSLYAVKPVPMEKPASPAQEKESYERYFSG